MSPGANPTLSVEAGCWRATVYNRMYHPRGYVRPEDGGAMVEYRALIDEIDVSPLQIQGPKSEALMADLY